MSMSSLYNWYRQTIRHPKYRWWLILGTLVYLLSPIDIAPDFIPIVGQVDDVMIATLLVTELSQLFLARFKSSEEVEKDTTASTANSATVEVEAETVVPNP